ncbi:MAG TPA: transcription elongation factor GreAB [Verrucomicrobiae bacterium]|nr:transcription elongation factor GreAB [Verrucomicrobiae bacterium]
MNKQALARKIVTQLVEELERNRRAAQTAHAEATHEQSKAENKYDTRGLEASYLAHGQARQMMEMEAAILAFQNMDLRRFGAGDPICTGALVELEHDAERTFYFIGSKAGGMEVRHEGHTVLVITPYSPLGTQLQDKKQGDLLQLSLGGTKNKYRVVEVS